eukprot:TRINITY_DN52910_c0_g1_i1.p1 TRINITY_DN52910_c0_g1~~TRINITY_DN52910_c0_g1_i1.p1  ORF type:complete len:100 (+),score=8.48 TRINITY_DN52910_c0_g1_i1:320-619(+)
MTDEIGRSNKSPKIFSKRKKNPKIFQTRIKQKCTPDEKLDHKGDNQHIVCLPNTLTHKFRITCSKLKCNMETKNYQLLKLSSTMTDKQKPNLLEGLKYI